VIRAILRYWVKNPDAKDTADGILKWWLPGDRAGSGKEEVQKALDALICKGWLIKRETTPNRIIYGLHKERVEEIKKFLNGFSIKGIGAPSGRVEKYSKG